VQDVYKTPYRANPCLEEFRIGDKAEWKISQGTNHWGSEKKLPPPTDIKGHHVAASVDVTQSTSDKNRQAKLLINLILKAIGVILGYE